MADPFIAPAQSNAPGLSGVGQVINGQDPNYLYSVMQANRQKMLADALTQQGMSPIDYDHAGAISPLQGLAKMLQVYAGTQGAASANRTLADTQSLGNQRAMQGLQGLFGGQVQDPSVAASASMAQGAVQSPSTPGADGQMVNQGGVGPTVANAQRMGQMMSKGTGAQGAAFGVPGLSPQQMTMAYLMDPVATMKAALDSRSLTDAQKNSRDSLIGTPTVANLETQNMTPEQKMLLQLQKMSSAGVPSTDPTMQGLTGAISKANYISPVEVKQGNMVLDPRTGNPTAYNPSVADGIVPTFSTVNGQTSPTQFSAGQGYAEAAAKIEGAIQGAKSSNTIITVPGPTGGQQTDWGSKLAGGLPAAQAGVTGSFQGNPSKILDAINSIQDPQEKANALAAFSTQSKGPQSSGTVGQSTSDQQINESAGKVMASLPQTVVQARQVGQGLDNALSALENTTTGPGTAKAFSLAATLQNMGLPVAKTPTENYQTLTKYLNNSLAISAGVNGNTGSDARFEQFMHGQPSADLMSKGPLRGAIQYVRSQIDAIPAGAQVMQDAYAKAKAAGDPNAAYTAQKAWSDQYDPRVFQFNRMSPDEKAAFKAHLMQTDPAKAQSFGQKYNQFHQQNWVN